MKASLLTTTLCALTCTFASSSQANIQTPTEQESSLELVSAIKQEERVFAQHVKRLCLSQVHDEDLEAKYINEYLAECAAVYGVFDSVEVLSQL